MKQGSVNHHSSAISFDHPIAFWSGTFAIVAGVCLHLPMFLHAASMGYRMAGMPMDIPMTLGMALIIFGTIVAAYGLVPRNIESPNTKNRAKQADVHNLRVRTMDDVRLSPAHFKMLAVLGLALIIDVMKPATLGFVMPGMTEEYGITKSTVAILPLVALTGTVTGSIMWGFLGDIIGRRGSILLASLMFIGTAICGAMPSFAWNVFMCFIMGLSAGGLLPIVFTLLAETIPARHRSWLLVLIAGIGTVGGYLVAAGFAALLEPHFGWRILWFLGLPTGALLILLNRYIPESPRFLMLQGKSDEALHVMAGFGAEICYDKPADDAAATDRSAHRNKLTLFKGPHLPLTLTLNFYGLAWGLVNFGFLLWLPMNLRNLGLTVGFSDAILANSAIISFIGVPLAAWLHHKWSTKRSMILFTMMMVTSLLGFVILGENIVAHPTVLTFLIVTLLISVNSSISMLLPYSAEVYPNHVRATGVGMVAGSTKMGGVLGLGAAIVALVPGLAPAALFVAVPALLSAILLSKSGVETRGLRLEEIYAREV